MAFPFFFLLLLLWSFVTTISIYLINYFSLYIYNIPIKTNDGFVLNFLLTRDNDCWILSIKLHMVKNHKKSYKFMKKRYLNLSLTASEDGITSEGTILWATYSLSLFIHQSKSEVVSNWSVMFFLFWFETLWSIYAY